MKVPIRKKIGLALILASPVVLVVFVFVLHRISLGAGVALTTFLIGWVLWCSEIVDLLLEQRESMYEQLRKERKSPKP